MMYKYLTAYCNAKLNVISSGQGGRVTLCTNMTATSPPNDRHKTQVK